MRPFELRRDAALLVLLLLLALQPGCLTSYVADRIASPTNGGRAELPRRLSVPPVFDAAHAVPVGPPDATLACFVIEPRPYALRRERPEGDAADALAGRWGGVSAMGIGLDRGDGEDSAFWILYPRKPRDGTDDPYRRKPRGTVVVLQGWSGSAAELPYLLPLAASLADGGFRVLMPDLRGQGSSTGDTIGMGSIDAADLRQLLDHLESRGVVAGPVGVLGHSYGAGVAILAAAEDKRIQAVIALSPWHDARQSMPISIRAGARQLKPTLYLLFGWLFSEQTLTEATELAARRVGVDPADASPLRAMPRTSAKVLILHGSEDRNCLVEWSEQLHDARPAGTTLLAFPGEDHWSYLDRRWPEVEHACRGWLDRHLRPSPQAVTSRPAD